MGDVGLVMELVPLVVDEVESGLRILLGLDDPGDRSEFLTACNQQTAARLTIHSKQPPVSQYTANSHPSNNTQQTAARLTIHSKQLPV